MALLLYRGGAVEWARVFAVVMGHAERGGVPAATLYVDLFSEVPLQIQITERNDIQEVMNLLTAEESVFVAAGSFYVDVTKICHFAVPETRGDYGLITLATDANRHYKLEFPYATLEQLLAILRAG